MSPPASDRRIALTPLSEFEKAVQRALAGLDVDALAAQAVAESAERGRA